MIQWRFENRFNVHAEVATSLEPKYENQIFPSNKKNIH